ncbi:MAG TPA: hypothetical protein PLX03_05820, partial [Candidatus Hydrogenedentes bacterium]|nr:hypothetical protein [Candidatus Hydrogenedentota bacterium]
MIQPQMAIAAYLARRAVAAERVQLPDGPNPELVVVIPAMAEWPGLLDTLRDLEDAVSPETGHRVLVLVAVNHPKGAASDVQENNRRTLESLADPVKLGLRHLRLGVIDAASVPAIPEKEGVGTARKLGMDLALRLLWEGNRLWGGIVCLDADTRVPPSYVEQWLSFFGGERRWGAVCDAWHLADAGDRARDAVTAYECRLRCHDLGLRLAGSPYGYPAIGSAMACSAVAYAAAGGMNRRSAGEDYYFLQALAKTGWVEKVPELRVFPAGRISDRVPFGTGRSIQQALSDARERPTAYHPEIYQMLRQVLSASEALKTESAEAFMRRLEQTDEPAGIFFARAGFPEIWPRIAATHREPAAR